MEQDEDAWLEDGVDRVVKALGKYGRVDSGVIRSVEEALRRAKRLRNLEAILADIRTENARLHDEVRRLLLEVNQGPNGSKIGNQWTRGPPSTYIMCPAHS
jgi:hypothetical protein